MTYVSPTPPRAIVPAPAASRFRTRGFVWWLPLVVAALAAAAAFALSEMQEQVYESRAALLAPEGGPLTPEALVAELQREAVFAQTIGALQLDTTAEALRERIDVRSEGIVNRGAGAGAVAAGGGGAGARVHERGPRPPA